MESGTHLSNTKEAEAFALVSEEGIAKGVRRVIALTMGAAKEAIHQSAVFSGQINEASTLQGAALEKVSCSYLLGLPHTLWFLRMILRIDMGQNLIRNCHYEFIVRFINPNASVFPINSCSFPLLSDVLSALYPYRLASTCLQEVAALKNQLETLIIPASKKAEFRTRLGELQVNRLNFSCFFLCVFVRVLLRRVSLTLSQ